MKKRKYLNQFSIDEILSVFSNYKIRGEKAFVQCLNCNHKDTVKEQNAILDLTKKFVNCLVCGGLNEPTLEALKHRYNDFDNNYQIEAPKIKIQPQEETKKQINYYSLDKHEKKKINDLLHDLFFYLDLDPLHEKIFKEKRGFKIYENVKSTRKLKMFIFDVLNNKSSPLYGKHELDTFEKLVLVPIKKDAYEGYAKEYQEKNILISFFKDLKGNFSYYQVYDIEQVTFFRDKKRLPLMGFNNQAYNVYEFLNNRYDKEFYFITESVEKLECLRALGYEGIGLTGITQRSALKPIYEHMRGKKFIILFDTKKELYSNEKTNREALVKDLEDQNIECYISDLPLNLNESVKEYDIDDYLNKFDKTRDKIREVEKVIKNRKSLKQIKDNFTVKNNNKEIFSKRNKIEVDYIRSNEKYKSITEIRTELPKILKDFISQSQDFYDRNKVKNLLIKAPAGAGKTTSLLDLIKHLEGYKQKVLYVTNNKNLINELKHNAIQNNISVNHLEGISDLCLNTHEKNKDIIQEDYSSHNKLKKLQKANSSYLKACQYCKIKSVCKVREEIDKDYSEIQETLILATLDKFVTNKNKFDDLKHEVIIFDEDIINNLIIFTSINLQDINKLEGKHKLNKYQYNFIKFVKMFLSDLKNHCKKNNDIKSLSWKELKAFLDIYNQEKGLKKFLSSIPINELKLIGLDQDLDNLLENENEDLLSNLFSSIKKNNLFYSNECLTFGIKKDLKIKANDKSMIFLDSTGSKELLQYYFKINDENIQIYEPKIYSDHLKIHQNNDKTFSQSNLLSNDKDINSIKNFIQKNTFDNDKPLLIANKKVIEKFKDIEGLQKANFGNLRGLNQFSECNKLFILNNATNFNAIELKAKLLFDVENTEKTSNFVNTNIALDNGKFEGIKNITYKDELLNELLKLNREAEIYQAIKRIDRNTDNSIKEVYLFSDISMNDYFNETFSKFSLEKNKTEKYDQKYNEIKKVVNNLIKQLNCFSLSFLNNKMNEKIKELLDIEIEPVNMDNKVLKDVVTDLGLLEEKRSISIDNVSLPIKLYAYDLDHIEKFVSKFSNDKILTQVEGLLNNNNTQVINNFTSKNIDNFNIVEFIQNYKFYNRINHLSYLDVLNNQRMLNEGEFIKAYDLNLKFIESQAEIINNSGLPILDITDKIVAIINDTFDFNLASSLYLIYTKFTNGINNIIEFKQEKKKTYPSSIRELLDNYKDIRNQNFDYSTYSILNKIDIEKDIVNLTNKQDYLRYISNLDTGKLLNDLWKFEFNYNVKKMYSFSRVLKYMIYQRKVNKYYIVKDLFLVVFLYNFINELVNISHRDIISQDKKLHEGIAV